jgi:hypothetical protein
MKNSSYNGNTSDYCLHTPVDNCLDIHSLLTHNIVSRIKRFDYGLLPVTLESLNNNLIWKKNQNLYLNEYICKFSPPTKSYFTVLHMTSKAYKYIPA